MVFLAGQFLAFGQGVFFVRRRADGEVFGRGHGDVGFGVDLAGDDSDIASSLDAHVAAAFQQTAYADNVAIDRGQ